MTNKDKNSSSLLGKNTTSHINLNAVSGKAHGFFENIVRKESEYGDFWLTTPEAARFLKLSPNALRIAVHRGQVRAYKFGRRLRFRLSELSVLPKEIR